MKKIIFTIMGIFALTLGACAPQPGTAPEDGSQAEAGNASLRVLAANSFLADIAQNVALFFLAGKDLGPEHQHPVKGKGQARAGPGPGQGATQAGQEQTERGQRQSEGPGSGH